MVDTHTGVPVHIRVRTLTSVVHKFFFLTLDTFVMIINLYYLLPFRKTSIECPSRRARTFSVEPECRNE